MADESNAAAPGSDSDGTVTVRELQERSNKSSWRIVTIVIAVIVAVFVVLGIAVFANPTTRDQLTNRPVNSSQPSEAPIRAT